jgi:hypothetical protein
VERAASVREPQHLLLTRPRDRCIEKAGDTDSARQPTIDSGLDEPWREESQRYRHAHVALAAGLPCGGGQRPQMWWSSRRASALSSRACPGGPLPLALGCPAMREGSPWVRFPEGGRHTPLHDLPIRYPQRYPIRGIAP